MKAIVLKAFGDADVLEAGDRLRPTPGVDELLVRVRAAGVNRADLLQRRGLYPPPPGASDILGLEMAGVVEAAGAEAEGFVPGDRVAALLPGGGYAEYVTVPAAMAMPLPHSFSFEEGAALPEVFLTAYQNLVWLGGIASSMTVLIHAGASGVGTAAIQIARDMGARVLTTAGSPEKLAFCRSLGAAEGWNYRDGSFGPWLKEATRGHGVGLILDFVGAPYFQDNLDALSVDGKLLLIGTMGGNMASQLDLSQVLSRRIQIIGTALRSRSLTDKIRLTFECYDYLYPRLCDGRIRPIIDKVFDWREAAEAHRYMESNANIGKIILKIPE